MRETPHETEWAADPTLDEVTGRLERPVAVITGDPDRPVVFTNLPESTALAREFLQGRIGGFPARTRTSIGYALWEDVRARAQRTGQANPVAYALANGHMSMPRSVVVVTGFEPASFDPVPLSMANVAVLLDRLPDGTLTVAVHTA
jgi:hypothetical protein